MTENLVAAAAFYSALGLRRGSDWRVVRAEDGTPVAKCVTPEAWQRAHAAMNAAVACLSGGWWSPE
jgi:hypothetical protein